jgi:hypothetical protein
MPITDNFIVNFTRAVTVTSAKMSYVFTEQVSSARTNTSHLQIVQKRLSAAPWHLERQVYVVRILFRVVNDLSTVAVATGNRSKRLIVAENVRVIFFILGQSSQSYSSISGFERSPSKRVHLTGGPWYSESLG